MTTDAPVVAFYAPLKSPFHPSPSGDRTMALLTLKALQVAGFEPHLASECRTLDLQGDAQAQDRIRAQTAAAAERLLTHYRSLPDEKRPRLWFSYHVYYKAPDLIGPVIADAFGIPYVVAEGSRSAKRAVGSWAAFHAIAEQALDRADVIFAMTRRDREGLVAAARPDQRIIDLPPFLDEGEWPCIPARKGGAPARLLAVGMMRPGDKLESYRLLAAALQRVAAEPWILDVVGDGPARHEVETLLAPFSPRVRWHGEVRSRAGIAALYAESDLLVWPAVNEAYGMALLEAQAMGCPPVAGAFGGVPDVVQDGVTGLLTRPGDVDAFAAAISELLVDRERRDRLGTAASRFVRGERTLTVAADILGRALKPVLAIGSA
ncbi:glycosyltransferase family 4 protein [Microvirga massiliensis]|uniref:glycosyltransferase family 4 protein n=1 Tax=Microvirga massiliensis TaxID=1033741 RepID=UPI000A8B6064|nr:glycosyltransferase family 4 protein [Microvirga massiliensis]